MWAQSAGEVGADRDAGRCCRSQEAVCRNDDSNAKCIHSVIPNIWGQWGEAGTQTRGRTLMLQCCEYLYLYLESTNRLFSALMWDKYAVLATWSGRQRFCLRDIFPLWWWVCRGAEDRATMWHHCHSGRIEYSLHPSLKVEGWRRGSVSKVLDLKHEDPNMDPQNPHGMQSCMSLILESPSWERKPDEKPWKLVRR